MPRKKTKKKTNRPKKSFNLLRVILGILSVFSLLISYQINANKEPIVCANSISCVKNLSVDIDNNAVGVFDGHTVIPPKIELSMDNTKTAVLGANTAEGAKHIYVDLTNQRLYAYQGNNLVMQTFISSGKWHPTPDGNFTIWVTLRATRMVGGSGADYYNLPNVPYVMFFYNKDVPKSAGFALHGAYWHDNFGYPMSHGCINMRITDARALYNWVNPATNGRTTYATISNPGTPITIFGHPVDL